MLELRQQLAEARINLRSARDRFELTKALCEQRAIVAGRADGKNAEERSRNLTVALANDGDYGNALMELREAEAAVARIEAQIAEQEYELRVREVAARERLAEALMGRRSDDAAIDTLSRVEAAQRRGYAPADTTEWYGR